VFAQLPRIGGSYTLQLQFAPSLDLRG
jgi:hypothetical protein